MGVSVRLEPPTGKARTPSETVRWTGFHKYMLFVTSHVTASRLHTQGFHVRKTIDYRSTEPVPPIVSNSTGLDPRSVYQKSS